MNKVWDVQPDETMTTFDETEACVVKSLKDMVAPLSAYEQIMNGAIPTFQDECKFGSVNFSNCNAVMKPL